MPGILITVWVLLIYTSYTLSIFLLFPFTSEDPEKTISREKKYIINTLHSAIHLTHIGFRKQRVVKLVGQVGRGQLLEVQSNQSNLEIQGFNLI